MLMLHIGTSKKTAVFSLLRDGCLYRNDYMPKEVRIYTATSKKHIEKNIKNLFNFEFYDHLLVVKNDFVDYYM